MGVFWKRVSYRSTIRLQSNMSFPVLASCQIFEIDAILLRNRRTWIAWTPALF